MCESFLLRINHLAMAGFPHSETAGSKVYGPSPTSIAAVCVLPRSKPPRHPLLALLYRFTHNQMIVVRLDSRQIFLLRAKLNGYSLHLLKSLIYYFASSGHACDKRYVPNNKFFVECLH